MIQLGRLESGPKYMPRYVDRNELGLGQCQLLHLLIYNLKIKNCLIVFDIWGFILSKQVSFGWGHALAQTSNGKLFGWGYTAEGRLGQIGQALETSASGTYLSKATADSGSALEVAEKLVLEEMGKENNMPIVWEPCLVHELDGIEVADVACGLDHSLALCCEYFPCIVNEYSIPAFSTFLKDALVISGCH